jgi:hypothetical protein
MLELKRQYSIWTRGHTFTARWESEVRPAEPRADRVHEHGLAPGRLLNVTCQYPRVGSLSNPAREVPIRDGHVAEMMLTFSETSYRTLEVFNKPTFSLKMSLGKACGTETKDMQEGSSPIASLIRGHEHWRLKAQVQR